MFIYSEFDRYVELVPLHIIMAVVQRVNFSDVSRTQKVPLTHDIRLHLQNIVGYHL
jgi:hypothetical protein